VAGADTTFPKLTDQIRESRKGLSSYIKLLTKGEMEGNNPLV